MLRAHKNAVSTHRTNSHSAHTSTYFYVCPISTQVQHMWMINHIIHTNPQKLRAQTPKMCSNQNLILSSHCQQLSCRALPAGTHVSACVHVICGRIGCSPLAFCHLVSQCKLVNRVTQCSCERRLAATFCSAMT